MIALNNIIDKIIKQEDISCNIINIFFLQSLGQTSDISLYKHCILDNDFIDNSELKIIENLYFKAKKIKNSISKFIQHICWNKSVNYNNDTDLYLNPLSSFQNKYKITLLENNTRYKFRLSDLVNYWIESLTNSSGLFSRPLKIKNPHTNLNFSRHNLYNIYFKLLNTGFDIPLCIAAFFKSEMNLKKFSYQFYPMLKERTIENFINSNTMYEKWEQIMNMLHDFRKDIDYITFTNHISYRTKTIVCKQFKQHLLFYLKYKFSCNPLVQRDFKFKTKESLKEYLEAHPDFDFTRGNEIMRFVPHTDRPRRRRPTVTPPAPPPQIILPVPASPPSPININIPPAPSSVSIAHSIPPPLPPQINPFIPSRELPRSPHPISSRSSVRTTMASSLSLFRR